VIKITIDPFQDLFGPFAVMIIVIIIIFVVVFVVIIYFIIRMFTGSSKQGEGISSKNPYSAKYYRRKEKEKEASPEICNYCGEKIEENIKICPHCGQDLT
jgi:uncharacterized membrane protein